jgi:hypothetical protein
MPTNEHTSSDPITSDEKRTTLDDKLSELTPERRAKIEARADELRPANTLLCLAAMLLVGCAKPPGQVAIDEKREAERGLLRRQYFAECMRLLPAGPQSTHYNDWDEVVKACDRAAWYQAKQVMP